MPRRRLDAVEPPIIIIITPAASDTGSKDQQKRIFPPQFKFWSRILSHNICLEEVIEEFPEQDEAATDVVRAMNEAVKGNPRLPSFQCGNGNIWRELCAEHLLSLIRPSLRPFPHSPNISTFGSSGFSSRSKIIVSLSLSDVGWKFALSC